MAVALEDRPREQVKEEVIDQLIINYSHGVISEQAFERRLDQAMQANSNERLMSLVADLELGKADENYQAMKQRGMQGSATPAAVRTDKQLTVLSSNHCSGEWVVPEELRVTTVLGSNKLDFTHAVFQTPQVIIHLNSYLSEDTIWVPENADVQVSVSNLLSSIENNAGSRLSTDGPRIVVTGRLVLGSVKISVKQSMKDKFMKFANEMKAMFSGDGSST